MRIERGRIFFMEVLVGEDMRRILRGFYPMLLGLLGLWVLMCLKVSFFFLFQEKTFIFPAVFLEHAMAIHALLICKARTTCNSLIPTLGATYLYNLNFFGGFIVAAAIYWILCKIKPIPACSDIWREVDNDVESGEDDYDDDDDVSDARDERRGRRRRNLAYGEEESDSDAKRQTTELPKGVV